VPRRCVQLAHGASGRRKTVAIDLPPAAVATWLDRVLAAHS